MAALTSARISVDPGAGASVVSTTTWNVRDMGGVTAGSLGLDGGPMIDTTTNDVRSVAIFGGVGVSDGLAGLRTPKASSVVVAGSKLQ